MFFVVRINVNVQDIQCFCLHLFSLTNISETKKNIFLQRIRSKQCLQVQQGVIDSSCGFFFYGYSFLLWLVFLFMVFPYKVQCKRQHMLQIFRNCSFCVATVKLLQSPRLFEILLLKYCSAGVTEVYPNLIPYPTIPYLNISKFTLSQYITDLYPIPIHYQIKPYLNTLPNYTRS